MNADAVLSLESYRPAPDRLWIRHRPRNWPGAGGRWTDWARRTLGSPGRAGAALPRSLGRPLTDTVYLPPVPAELEEARIHLAGEWLAAGVPVVLQRLPGEEGIGTPADGSLWDLLPALLADDPAVLAALPRGAATVWPLVAGLTDREELVEEGLRRLLAAKVAVVQPLVLELSSAARRGLATQAGEAAFDRLFHGPAPSARRFSALASRRGLSPFIDRPLPSEPPRLVVRRRCAGELRLVAELYHRLGRSEADEQQLLRAARWIDQEDYDLAALAAEGNLSIVDRLDETSRKVVEEVVDGERSELGRTLLAEYTQAAGDDGPGAAD